MRFLLILGCFLLAGLWLASDNVGADATSATARAESMEASLQAVEWYTDESVHKALQAELAGDLANAQLFGNKAIESDLKAQGLRSEAAAAWEAAGQPDRAHAAWHRAADMAKARAGMLADRAPKLLQQWHTAQGSNNPAATQEAEVLYLQALLYTAEQWALAAQFSGLAAETDQVDAAIHQLQTVIPPLQQDNRLVQKAADPRLVGGVEKLRQWEQMISRP